VLVGMRLSTPRFGEGGSCSARAAGVLVSDSLYFAACAHHDGHRRRATVRSLGLGPVQETRVLVGSVSRPSALFSWHEPLVRWLAHKKITLEGRRGCLLSLLIVGVQGGMLAALTWFVETPAIRLKTPVSFVQANAAGSAVR
jgi:hypothetical protein